MTEYDVIICGAGPGGLTAAILLGRQDRRVLLVDKLTDTVETFKGELLQPGSLSILDDMGALRRLRDSGARTINRLVSSTSDGTELCSMDYRLLPSRYNHCLTHTYKGILENFVTALPATVDFRRGVSVARALRGDDGRVRGVEVRTGGSREQVRAPLVIASDGYSSKLRGQLGIETEVAGYEHQVVAIDLVDEPFLATQATTFITPAGILHHPGRYAGDVSDAEQRRAAVSAGAKGFRQPDRQSRARRLDGAGDRGLPHADAARRLDPPRAGHVTSALCAPVHCSAVPPRRDAVDRRRRTCRAPHGGAGHERGYRGCRGARDVP